VKREGERELLYKAPCQKTCKERDFVFPAEKTQKRGRAHAKLLVKKHAKKETLCSLLKKPKKGEELMQSSLSKKREKREVELLLLGERYCNLFA
jgi:hypothetical protein